MPPLIHVVTGWLAGAFAGSTPAWETVAVSWLVTAAAVAATLLGWVAGSDSTSRGAQRPALCIGLAAVAIAGVLSARASVSRGRACRLGIAAAIAGRDRVRAVFDDRVAAGVSARGVAAGPGALASCRVPVVARIATGTAAPGHWVRMVGRAIVTSRGLRVEGDITALPRADLDWRRVARGRTGEIIDRDFGAHAPLVRALLIADQDGIAPDVRDTFADAGLVHLLSISGLHVAIIAGALLTLAGALRIPRTASYVAAMLVIAAYVVVLGAPAPAVRSAVMLGVVGLAERRQRPTHPWTALALGAVIPAWQPSVVLDLGWQLSVSGMAALVAARALLRRMRHAERRGRPRWSRRALARFQALDGWRYGLARELITGTVATLVTAPLIAWTFGRISLVAPFSNLAAGPLVAFVQPALFLALLAAPWPSLSGVIASASAPPLVLLDLVAHLSAAVPGASVHLAPTALGAACAASPPPRSCVRRRRGGGRPGWWWLLLRSPWRFGAPPWGAGRGASNCTCWMWGRETRWRSAPRVATGSWSMRVADGTAAMLVAEPSCPTCGGSADGSPGSFSAMRTTTTSAARPASSRRWRRNAGGSPPSQPAASPIGRPS